MPKYILAVKKTKPSVYFHKLTKQFPKELGLTNAN
jgi:hypothetical protein